ncbi:hypothetical protein [Ligilactobacillus aviarius]|uniref:hypothetical protein n=1 Tax=Ligilactobacillus aviarius TaxID=1606 RepID=UPI0024B8BDAD|nr:hypothetical protein [Ligilactobacillus aviarius]
MLLMRIFGVVLFLIGLWQFYATWKYHHFLTTKGTDNVFSPLALYYGFFRSCCLFTWPSSDDLAAMDVRIDPVKR